MSWDARRVAERFESCVEVLEQLPPVRVGGYASYWPVVVHSPAELSRQQGGPLRVPVLADEILAMEETLGWVQWVDERERKLIWYRASQMPWRTIAVRSGLSRTTAQRYWWSTLGVIAQRLA